MKTAGKEPFPVIYVDGKEDGKVNFFSTLAMSNNVRYFLYQNQRLSNDGKRTMLQCMVYARKILSFNCI